MKEKRPTSLEVARRAGVSRSTVSFALNGVAAANISAATRARVLQAARELGNVPDAAARTLATGRTDTLGLVICRAEHLRVDAFVPQALHGVYRVARGRGFRVVVEALEDPDEPNAYLQLVRAKQVDGLVVINPRHGDRQLSGLVKGGFPLVIMGASEVFEAHTVSTAHNAAPAKGATEHLLRLGHTRVAHVSYGSFEYQGTTERLQGYQQALAGAGLPFDRTLVREGDFSPESGYAAMNSLLEVGADFTAVFVSNDTVALGALAALRAHRRRIPDDVAVVGYDDIPLAAFAAPPLTTVRSPALEHGELAAEILIALVRGEEVKNKVPLATELVVRASCGANR